MSTSNYSRSYWIEFPASVEDWFTPNGTSFTANVNMLKLPKAYVDSTKRNYRKITFHIDVAVPNLSFTFRGYEQEKGYTEETVLLNNITDAASIGVFSYIDFLTPSLNVQGVKVGNAEGNSGWIYHDGSRFKNIVRLESATPDQEWSVVGTDKKVEFGFSPSTIPPLKPFDVDTYPYNIDTALTDQSTSTTAPIFILMPIEGLRLNVKSTVSSPKIEYAVVWQYTTQNLL